jgi:hypothetical protein
MLSRQTNVWLEPTQSQDSNQGPQPKHKEQGSTSLFIQNYHEPANKQTSKHGRNYM